MIKLQTVQKKKTQNIPPAWLERLFAPFQRKKEKNKETKLSSILFAHTRKNISHTHTSQMYPFSYITRPRFPALSPPPFHPRLISEPFAASRLTFRTLGVPSFPLIITRHYYPATSGTICPTFSQRPQASPRGRGRGRFLIGDEFAGARQNTSRTRRRR